MQGGSDSLSFCGLYVAHWIRIYLQKPYPTSIITKLDGFMKKLVDFEKHLLLPVNISLERTP